MNFQPLNDNVLIKLESKEEQTKSGLYIPDTAKSEKDEGEVIAVPPGGGEEIATGDRVMFKRTNAIEIKDGNDLYMVMPFKNIVGKFVDVDEI